MSLSAKVLSGYRLDARDGELGRVESFLFDDASWSVRYLLARTGRWLGREVLLHPEVLGAPDSEGPSIAVDLTREQIRHAPELDTDAPISRQYEKALAEYFDWPAYWTLWATPEQAPPPAEKPAGPPDPRDAEPRGDPNLRSTAAVIGYDIHARDGAIGHVEDFLIDAEVWSVRNVVIDTRNWLPSPKVLVAPTRVLKIDWNERVVVVELTREQVRQSPEVEELARRD